MVEPDLLECAVAYARPEAQHVIKVSIPRGTTVLEAVRHSAICERCPEILTPTAVFGIFGKPVGADHVLQDGDRVEIYRPLTADPRAARRERVDRTRNRGRRP